MLIGERDKLGGPSGYAIPSMGGVEGRTLVLQVIAIATLGKLLKRRDERGKTILLAALRRAIKRKSKHTNLTEADTAAALEYAQGLFEEALKRANGGSTTERR